MAGTGRLTYADLPWRLEEPFKLETYSQDMSLLLFRHRGPYPVDNSPDAEDADDADPYVPLVIDLMFDRVRALATRTYYDSMFVREATEEEKTSLFSWLEPRPWRGSRAYVLGEHLSAGWVIANHVYRTSARMDWDDPSTLLTDIAEGRVVGEVIRNWVPIVNRFPRSKETK